MVHNGRYQSDSSPATVSECIHTYISQTNTSVHWEYLTTVTMTKYTLTVTIITAISHTTTDHMLHKVDNYTFIACHQALFFKFVRLLSPLSNSIHALPVVYCWYPQTSIYKCNSDVGCTMRNKNAFTIKILGKICATLSLNI